MVFFFLMKNQVGINLFTGVQKCVSAEKCGRCTYLKWEAVFFPLGVSKGRERVSCHSKLTHLSRSVLPV